MPAKTQVTPAGLRKIESRLKFDTITIMCNGGSVRFHHKGTHVATLPLNQDINSDSIIHITDISGHVAVTGIGDI